MELCMKPKSWKETAPALKASVVDSLHRYSFWQWKNSRLSSLRQHGLHSKCTNLLDSECFCFVKWFRCLSQVLSNFPEVFLSADFFPILYSAVCKTIKMYDALLMNEFSIEGRLSWFNVAGFLSPQFVVITVCLKAGLETSSWTMVSWWLSLLSLMFSYLFPVPPFYMTNDTCDIFYILFLSLNPFMVCSHWACSYKPSEITRTVWYAPSSY